LAQDFRDLRLAHTEIEFRISLPRFRVLWKGGLKFLVHTEEFSIDLVRCFMAKAKTQLKTLYHDWFEGEGLGEADGFFEIVNGKLEYVTGWFANDAMWRPEYMEGLIEHFGGKIEDLPNKHHVTAAKLMCEAFGLDYEGEEEEPGSDSAFLAYTEGTSDKVYHLYLTIQDSNRRTAYTVQASYGRRGSDLRSEVKYKGGDYEIAKQIYDKVLKEKLNKGYQRYHTGNSSDDGFEDEY
jgi:hypothetical protein